jgi:ATP/maltotriose-dependent transcriptional regulator MalT
MGKLGAHKRVGKRQSTSSKRRTPAKRAPLPAKICVPRLTETYRRQRLFRTLDAALQKRVVWIGAPAGAGKTSVVTTYLEARNLPTLWYNVDARDSDVANLFYYLSMAARLVAMRKKRLPVFSTEHQAGVGAFTRGFFEALGVDLPVPSAIVIDDYHEARSELLDEVLREAASALPAGVTLVIISRSESPRWLARLLASGDVASVGWDSLRLTPPEVTGLVRVYRRDLHGRDLRAMLPLFIEIANGWAAVLMLLLQSRQPPPVEAGGMEEFSERLFDYFATEILDKVTAAQREFLLKTSVVPSVTTMLAARLTGKLGAGDLLAELERRSYLIQRLGTAHRYHPLLRSFLRRQAEGTFGPSGVRDLHRVAAAAFFENGQVDDAMEQFEAAQDFEAYAGLLLSVAHRYITEGRGRTVEGWIARIPREQVDQNGWLLHWEGVSCLANSASHSREVLEGAYGHFVRDQDPAGLYSCCAAGMHAVIYEGVDHSRCDAWVARLESLLRSGPPCPEQLLPMVSTAMLMVSLFRRPEAADNHVWAERALALARTSKDVAHQVNTGGLLALRFVLHEGPARAAIIVQMLRESAFASQYSDLSIMTVLHARAMTAWAAGENDACIEIAREAHARASRTGVFVWEDYFCALGMASSLTSENFEAAREFLTRARPAAEQGRTFAVITYYLYASLEAFHLGDLAGALHLIEQALKSGTTFNLPLSDAAVEFGYAQVLWARGDKGPARAALGRARQHATQAGYLLVLQGCDLLESDLEWNEDRERALECLRRGLKLAWEGGYHNMFWLRKATLTNVAIRALELGIETAHVRTSIVRHRLVPPSVPLSVEAWPFRCRLRALGGFELSRDYGEASRNGASPHAPKGAPPALRSTPLHLLQAIIALGTRTVRDIDLIDALWPDAERDAGKRAFDTTLHRLRRQLGDDEVVRVDDGAVSLDEALCWVDVWELEQLAEQVERNASQSGPSAPLLEIGERLLALYRGPLLADEEGVESWAVKPRARLGAKFHGALEQLARALEQQGKAHDARRLLDRARERDHQNLSPRLRQTLEGLMRGMSEKQLASELALSQHTLHGYVKTLYRRLGVTSRGELHARFDRSMR